jgi:hypothetical protein
VFDYGAVIRDAVDVHHPLWQINIYAWYIL